MSYLILARKYRPKTFEEVIGQKSVVQTIENAITTGRIAQAYLFSGMRGTGKTTVARILAKALNCKDGPTPHPCNKCEFCTAINEDRAIDVLEIDGASNRGIEEIRALRESLKYKAIYTKYKVVIIDEVHQITKDGFNALLKTLEEPPPHTVFIFATTEFHKVMPTIVSRCQHFEFKKISHKDIINHLVEITRKESITVTPAGLAMIAEAADGSMRDAQSLLDQAVAFSGDVVGDDDLRVILGTIGREVLFGFSTAILDEHPEEIFPLVENLLAAGHDLRAFFGKLVEHFRDLLLVSSVKKPEDFLLASPDELQALRDQAAKAGPEDFLRYLLALQQGEAGLKYSAQPRIYLEAFLIKLCQFRKLVPLQDLIRNVEDLRKGGPGPAGVPPSARPASGGAPISEAPPRQAAPSAAPAAPTAKETFGRILERLARDKAPLAALVGQFSSVKIGDGVIDVVFERGKGFFGTAIQDKDQRAVEKAAAEVLGRETRVRFSEEGGPSGPSGPAGAKHTREVDAVLKDPAVQYFMKTFKAQVLSADPVKTPGDADAKDREPGENGS
jgi:DNA polymerase III subunit gamma/tau